MSETETNPETTSENQTTGPFETEYRELKAAVEAWQEIDRVYMPMINKGMTVPNIGQKIGMTQDRIARTLDAITKAMNKTPKDGVPQEWVEKVLETYNEAITIFNAFLFSIMAMRAQYLGKQNLYEHVLNESRFLLGKVVPKDPNQPEPPKRKIVI